MTVSVDLHQIRGGLLEVGLPASEDLDFLGQWLGPGVDSFELASPFLSPISEFLSRPAKQVRAQLVYSGFALARAGVAATAEEAEILAALSAWVEALHAGSLIIDDIQDSSLTRRGRPALHTLIGEPASINAANWLYFWPTERIQKLRIPQQMELELYRLYHHTMTRAHYGQALDLTYDMTRASRERTQAVSMAAIGLKTGALMRMCSEFGAIAAGAGSSERQALADFGQAFGVALQMFNDLADFRIAPAGAAPAVSFKTPSWVWAVAARSLDDADFFEFQQLMSLEPTASPLHRLGEHPVVETARVQAREAVATCVARLSEKFKASPAIHSIQRMADMVVAAYA